MSDFFRLLFSGEGFIPRAVCGRWTPGLIRLHNISDFFIWTAYLAIPIVLILIASRKGRMLPFRQLFWLFGLFIMACGTTHLMDIVLFYDPVYRLSGLIKAITAIASWGTVLALFHVVPQVLQMRTPDELESEIAERKQVEASLQESIRQHQATELALQAEVIQRQRLEAEWERIFDLSPDKLCVAGMDGYFRKLNPRWEKFGYSREELMAQPVVEFIHPEDRPEFEAHHQGQNESNDSFECRFHCKDGTYKWLAWRVKLVPEEEAVYASARDITERKLTEQTLKAAMLQLERSNRELQDFASIASHDLQEPLRAIQAFGERLQTRHGDQLDEQGKDYLNRVHRASGRMRSLIQDLLTYSRVSTKMQPFASIDLTTVTQAVLSDLAIRIEETGGTVEIGELPTLEADALQMRQLMQNLIANALKFHRDDAPPFIKVYATEPVQTELIDGMPGTQIVVEDNGIGFDSKFAERIFAPFERLHAKSKYAGTGIGLAICRKIVERHGGSIEVKSVPGQGSKFVITLPLQQPEVAFDELSLGQLSIT